MEARRKSLFQNKVWKVLLEFDLICADSIIKYFKGLKQAFSIIKFKMNMVENYF